MISVNGVTTIFQYLMWVRLSASIAQLFSLNSQGRLRFQNLGWFCANALSNRNSCRWVLFIAWWLLLVKLNLWVAAAVLYTLFGGSFSCKIFSKSSWYAGVSMISECTAAQAPAPCALRLNLLFSQGLGALLVYVCYHNSYHALLSNGTSCSDRIHTLSVPHVPCSLPYTQDHTQFALEQSSCEPSHFVCFNQFDHSSFAPLWVRE